MIYGIITPIDLIYAIQYGYNLFDTQYLLQLNQEKKALNFKYTIHLNDNDILTFDLMNNEHENNNVNMSPLVDNCQCPTCQHYSIAYLHHLFNAQEMLGQVLLYIHNCYYYTQFKSWLLKNISINS